MTLTGRHLSKSDLIARVSHRAASRYGVIVGQPWLNDLIKRRLILPGARAGNDRRRPVFKYDAAAYRRALQIARLRSRGVVARDAICLILFFNGYSLSASEARTALAREWPKLGKAILSQVRSGYVDNQRKIKPKHMKSLMEQFGDLDDRIANVGAKLSPESLVEALRGAVQLPMSSGVAGLPGYLLAAIENGSLDIDQLATVIGPAIAGMLMFDPAVEDGSDGDYFETGVLSASDDEFERARQLAAFFHQHVSSGLIGLGVLADTPLSNVLDVAFRRSVQNSGAWTALMLAMALRFVRNIPAMPTVEQICSMKQQLKHEKPDLSSLSEVEKRILQGMLGKLSNQPFG